MRILLIVIAIISFTSAYCLVLPATDTTRCKEKLKLVEKNKRAKKLQEVEEADVRIQPNFMTLMY